MGSEGNVKAAKKMVITQVGLGGFTQCTSAKDLTDFLEREIGLIWRCRLKTSWTPPDFYPDFEITDSSKIIRDDKYAKVAPHAFVHFAAPDAAQRAQTAVGRCALLLNGEPLMVNLGIESSLRVNRRRTIDPYKFSNVGVEIGNLVSRDAFWVGWKGPASGVDFLLDPFEGTCSIMFTRETAFSLKSSKRKAVIKCDFKVEFLVRELSEIKLYSDKVPFVMLLQLMSPPLVYYRTADDDIYISVPYNLLDDEDPWIRTTDFTPSRVLGRCNTFKISFSPRFGAKLEKAMEYIRIRRIKVEQNRFLLKSQDEPKFGKPTLDFFYCVQDKEGISFDILFLVNALVHQGIINQHQLSEDFFGLLRGQKSEFNVVALRHIYSYKRPVFDAYRRLKLVQEWLLKNPKLIKTSLVSSEHVEVRRLIITPTKAYCLPPEVELSNRVLRRYKDVADRFLRVTFMDEGMQQLNASVLTFYVAPIVKDITSNSFMKKTTVFNRVNKIMREGFHLCGRRYSFLAFSSNQLRDRSAWFFAEHEDITVARIMKWMGKFYNKNIAKCAARMGQCFSSTYATVNVPSKEVCSMLPDIERNGYVFSDGIGKISPDLAMEVAEKLQLTLMPPSAYQIRYAGCKGVIACWPGNNHDYRLFLRPSMNKFISNHTMLEVVSWTRFQPGFLNRQIVTLLSALGVPDEIFSSMQDAMVFKLNQILENTDVAYEILTTSCAEQGNNAAMMLSAGFKPQLEPHLRGMLSCVKSAQVGDLLDRARIFVPQGRWLLGCLDELEILEHGQCFIQVSTPSLENCFCKHGTRFSGVKNNAKVITGTVVIAKNPCLHPGDIRILEAVDMPDLHHLIDCLIFPQKGDRPHSNEASGSDLDGDLYFVTWDENLIPPGKKSCLPMDYTPAEAKELATNVTIEDIKDFFTRNMVSDNLGVICNAHVVHADLSDYGALDEKCLKLAELAALAVDYPKTGRAVTMPHSLKPKMYPDFMGKDEHMSYKSNKVMGRLYRKLKDTPCKEDLSEELPLSPEDIPYDTDLVVPGSENFISDAWNNKCSFDGALNALLGQFKVKTEEEVVTGHIWSMPKHNSRKQGDLKERLKNAFTSLQREFRRHFDDVGPEFQQLTEDEKNAVYEQKASAWYQVTYHPRWVERSVDLREPDGDGFLVRLSFPWIAADYLVRIKVCARGRRDSSRPIDSLARYLLDKI